MLFPISFHRQILGVFALCLILGMSVSTPAFAAKKKLNEKQVKEFIIQTANIASGQEAKMSLEQKLSYLEKHIEKNARFKSSMIYKVPGHPPQETSMSFGKNEFIENVDKGSKTIDEFEQSIAILNIQITKDKKRAMVKTKSIEAALMPVPDENGLEQDVPVEGTSTCDQIITISKKGVIQMYGATCKTEIEFMPF